LGTNKRYATSTDRQMSDRAGQVIMRDSEPVSLTDTELDLDRYDVTRTRNPRPVSAWVRYGAVPLRVEARAVAWTERAVAIEWTTPAGESHHAWVWASSVDNRPGA